MKPNEAYNISVGRKAQQRHAVRHHKAVRVWTPYEQSMALRKSIEREVSPIIQAERDAWVRLWGGVTAILENNEEHYGRKMRVHSRTGVQYDPRYCGSVQEYGMTSGQDCQAESEERDAALIKAVSAENSAEIAAGKGEE